MVGVQDLEAVDQLDVLRVDGARPLLVDADGVRLGLGRLEDDLLQVQHDVRHVLDDIADGGELVERPVQLHGRDGRALEGREEDATERVAERERLAAELPVELGERLALDLDAARPNQVPPVACRDVHAFAPLFSLLSLSRGDPDAAFEPALRLLPSPARVLL